MGRDHGGLDGLGGGETRFIADSRKNATVL